MAPGDKEIKEKLSRAKLKAHLVKAATVDGREDAANSRWDVLADNKVIFSATFNELTGGRSGLYGAVRTAEFAKELMKNIKADYKGATRMYKSAADPMAGLGGMGGDPMGAAADPGPLPAGGAPAPDMGGMGGGGMPDFGGGAGGFDAAGLGGEGGMEGVPENIGDPVERADVALKALKENVTTFSANMQELMSDIQAGWETLHNQGGELQAAGPEVGGMPGGMPGAAGGFNPEATMAQPEQAVTASLKVLNRGAVGPEATVALRNLQLVLNAGLKEAFKTTYAELKDSRKELDMIASTLNMPGINEINRSFVRKIAQDAMSEANEVVKKAKALQVAFIKYARGTYGLEKKAAIENRLMKVAAANKKTKKQEAEKEGKGSKKEDVKKPGKAGPPPMNTPAAKPGMPVPAANAKTPAPPLAGAKQRKLRLMTITI
jgi:hypothetical protein